MILPTNVIHAPEGRSLNAMMADGELVAGFDGAAGVGRTGSPAGGWQAVETDYPALFPNADELERDYYVRTGIYPIHGVVVVKDTVLAENPWVAKSLFAAFCEAKAIWLKSFHEGSSDTKIDRKYKKLIKIVGDDPLPYGMTENLPSIEALQRAAINQKLSPREMTIEELFVDPNT